MVGVCHSASLNPWLLLSFGLKPEACASFPDVSLIKGILRIAVIGDISHTL